MRRPVQPSTQSLYLSAPVGGINAVSPPTALPEGDCLYAYNVISGESGLRTRPGWEVQSRALTVGLLPNYRTLMGYKGSAADGGKDRLFVARTTGIVDSTDNGFDNLVATFTDSTGLAGLGVFTSTTNATGDRFIHYADEVNGLYLYTESTDVWAKMTQGVGAGQISGVDPAKLVFATVWKKRPFFVERDTSKAWYLDAGSISGPATAFDFGPQFRNGGHLVGLWSWTYDGGAGLDDSLVAVSSSGDIVIYQGTDPSSANTFGIKGVWSVGAVPAGRRIATNYGGDILILSFRGVISLERLTKNGGGAAEDLETFKFQPIFNRFAQTYRNAQGWSIHLHPAENALLVLVPSKGLDGEKDILIKSYATGGWFQWREMNLTCCDAWKGDLYFGTDIGRIGVNRGFQDYVDATPPEGELSVKVPNQPIYYSFQTGFSNMGRATQKQVSLISPTVISETVSPNIEVRAIHGVNTQEGVAGLIEEVQTASVGAWDQSNWDQAVWGGDTAVAQPNNASFGVAREVAVRVRGYATSRTNVVGFDVIWQEGGYL